jgi:A/G-specific adenine glycosylase
MCTTHAAAAAGKSASMAGESTPFADRLLTWAETHGRRGLPWQSSRDPYRVWLSEIMLQQTQVATVIGYYERFSARFPTVAALAAAALSEVMSSWAGLGYYSRARNLHACARRVVDDFDGAFPRDAAALASLPGIGRSTAAAIAALCFDERVPILDGNVKRVLARHFAIDGYPGVAAVERELWDRAASLLPQAGADMPAYTQAIMDLGAGVCTRRNPRCEACPLWSTCAALRQGRVGSLPVARPRRALVVRSAHWLLVLRDGRVLLEQRPGAGLWGGLLAPPQFEHEGDLRRAVLDADPQPSLQTLPSRRHAFTHFTLQYTPHVLRTRTGARCTEEPGRIWLAIDAAHEAALPAPVRALLTELAPTSRIDR